MDIGQNTHGRSLLWEAGHVEYLRDPEGVGYQLELAILDYFVHVLLSPLVLPHDALDSDHGC